MAITSELIGKLGGADVEVIPVDAVISGSSGTREVFYTAEVPEGETWLVAAHGNLQSHYAGMSSSVQMFIGTTIMSNRADSGVTGLAHVGTGTIEVGLKRNGSVSSDSFTGHIYTVKI